MAVLVPGQWLVWVQGRAGMMGGLEHLSCGVGLFILEKTTKKSFQYIRGIIGKMEKDFLT